MKLSCLNVWACTFWQEMLMIVKLGLKLEVDGYLTLGIFTFVP